MDLSGKWDGTYAYPPIPGAGPVTPFLAEIADVAGRLSGTIIEPNEFRPETARATLEGMRSDSKVDFLKIYHGAGEEYDEPVVYSGSLSDDGNVITGRWIMAEWSGTFEMVRHIEVTTASEALAEVEVDP
ncbi:hypothetical protein [Erythrobacter donghaensis]|uniref:hypothetical protein n=1 Tax=Erythrobacter donghaensis TaxID=267135 RepID=UPI00117D9F58|nr:hypothetical protein [Erythrobacter donghaensis]